MTGSPEFRPQTSAHSTVQPWGEQIVTPYSPAEENAWMTYVVRARIISGLRSLDHAGLEETMKAAREEGDTELIGAVRAECLARDGFDDTDASFHYLAIECEEAVSFLEGGNDGTN